jgi:hypothetical protein
MENVMLWLLALYFVIGGIGALSWTRPRTEPARVFQPVQRPVDDYAGSVASDVYRERGPVRTRRLRGYVARHASSAVRQLRGIRRHGVRTLGKIRQVREDTHAAAEWFASMRALTYEPRHALEA